MDGSSEMIRLLFVESWFASSWWRQSRLYQRQVCFVRHQGQAVDFNCLYAQIQVSSGVIDA
jgi:hypothetical protein